MVVVGGGIAGLATAYELGKAGYDCTVLEARGRAGGRNFTVRGGDAATDLHGNTQTARFSDGQYMNCGPARASPVDGHPRLLSRTRRPHRGVHQRQRGRVPLQQVRRMKKPVRYRTAKADVYGYVSELLAKATDKGALDKELTATDQERLVEFLKDWGELGDKLTYEGGERRGYTTVPAAAGTSRSAPR